MRFGAFGLGSGAADPGVLLRGARAAEDAGLDSIWTGELVLLPDPRTPDSPEPPEAPYLDPFAALSFMAAATSRIRLGAGVAIAPFRHPADLAKLAASADVLSGGRLELGIGAGYLRAQFDALGVEYSQRGARTDEAIDAARALWTQDHPRYAGRHYRFERVNAYPRPARACGPPIIVGGHSTGALRRAVERGDGWYGWKVSVEQMARVREAMARIAAQTERPPRLGELRIIVTPPDAPTPAEVEAYAAAEVDELVPELPRDESGILGMIESIGRLRG